MNVVLCRYIAQTASPKDPNMYIEIGSNRVEGAQSIIDYISRPLKFFRGRDMDIDRQGLQFSRKISYRGLWFG